MNEPILLSRDYNDKVNCFSNVCTHRGNILVENPDILKNIRCRYHGRQFDLNGCLKSMPEFQDVENFPSKSDNLHQIPFELFGKFIFISLNPILSFDALFSEIKKRLYWLPLQNFFLDSTLSKDYLVRANWALYCENYLEGFHIPYVHSGLNEKLDYSNYTSEIYEYSNLQLGIAKKGEECFIIPNDSPDYGKNIAAYYYWIFPNLMLNFYPWGLSINIVKPITKELTKVSFLTYLNDPAKLNKGAGADLDKVEREDEAIVENVQKGMNSRFYNKGRYSPKREQGVHHFHRLLYKFLFEN